MPSSEVHIYCASLKVHLAHVRRLQDTLSEDELDRANLFRFQRHKAPFIVARGILCTILGRYLRIEPSRIYLSYNEYGKPELVPSLDWKSLRFNISHSSWLALFVVASGRDVGVDIERIRKNIEFEEIATRLFSPHENIALRSVSEKYRAKAFFDCWTRKEAYVRALGGGLSIPLDQFDVSFLPGEPAMLKKTRNAPNEGVRWRLQDLRPQPGYSAAVAVNGHDWLLRRWSWTESPQ